MSDTSVVHIGENSPEEVAFKLMKAIAAGESKSLISSMAGPASADRKWILDTYAECLNVVRDPRGRIHAK